MKKYVVAIEETVVSQFEILADSSESAIATAKIKYLSGELVLSPGEVQCKRMDVVDPSKNDTIFIEF